MPCRASQAQRRGAEQCKISQPEACLFSRHSRLIERNPLRSPLSCSPISTLYTHLLDAPPRVVASIRCRRRVQGRAFSIPSPLLSAHKRPSSQSANHLRPRAGTCNLRLGQAPPPSDPLASAPATQPTNPEPRPSPAHRDRKSGPQNAQLELVKGSKLRATCYLLLATPMCARLTQHRANLT
ncbi:hypothetical protein BU26DRAFT_301757 [Trematosphaeria pertusa]|uniref:Uncharacterized protein n=1 Tax=Trematosphaeria pertusa TaxID=390896 RepID=A0A6A6IJP5_9PLEO|nr:uncharacterized protein BU26DRAFT_301757 [Trematosphaeria pertusa]KAF2250449.1 hypothetical protein BU26DRAFT_301757 [Trematosphaeria pertusa]